MFDSTVSAKRNWGSLIASVAIQIFAIAILILVPLIWTDSLPAAFLQAKELYAPPTPPPGPKAIPVVPVPKGGGRSKPATTSTGSLFIPREVPKEIPKDFGPIGDPSPGPNFPGIPNGIPGGTTDGCFGCTGTGPYFGPPTIVATPPPPPPAPLPPPPPQEPSRIQRIGGDVAQANLITQVKPAYPPLARTARVQGVVLLQATISKDGKIEDLRVLSGNPLLNDAAIEAVKQWRYRPQLLNGQPIEVVTTITVNFSFSQ